jgi:hypothetical protein
MHNPGYLSTNTMTIGQLWRKIRAIMLKNLTAQCVNSLSQPYAAAEEQAVLSQQDRKGPFHFVHWAIPRPTPKATESCRQAVCLGFGPPGRTKTV